MKSSFIIIVGLIAFVTIYFIYLSIKSHSGSPIGLINQKLSPCPDKPNCINSEFKDDTTHFVDAMTYQEKSTDQVIQAIEIAIQKTGGEITAINEKYIAATYKSKLFRFIDDLEIRLDDDDKLIHFRSASRVGRSDLGINIKRINLIKTELNIQFH